MQPSDRFQRHKVLLIGISTYQNQDWWSLPEIYQPRHDVERLCETFYSLGYEKPQLTCLLDQDASLVRIRAELKLLREAQERSSLLLIFWAGHGYNDRRHGKNYLLPWNTNLDQLDRTTLTMEELACLAGRSNGAHIAMVLDTCYSRPNSQGFIHPEWSGVWPYLLANRVLFFAGASSTLAEETQQGGILTQCLIEGLTDREGILADKDGFVTLEALAAHLQWRISERASYPYQYPYIATNPTHRIPIGRSLRKHVETSIDLAAGHLPRSTIELARLVARSRWPKSDEP